MRLEKVFWGLLVAGVSTILISCSGGESSSGLTSGFDLSGLNGSGSVEDMIVSPATDPRYLPVPDNSGGGTENGGDIGGGLTGDEPAKVVFRLVDAPNPAIDEAWVTISDVSVHKTGGAWFTVMGGVVEPLDLLDLQNGVSALLGEIDLEPGKYTQIRMQVDGDASWVVSEEANYPVDVPSDEIKVNHNLEICSGGEVEIVIDFDAEKSLKYNQGRDLFTMKPVVKVEQVSSNCPEEDSDSGDGEPTEEEDVEEEYSGALGWLSIVLPPINPEGFSSLTAVVNDIQVHDQGIGQVTTFTEDYEIDLLEETRQVSDPDTGEPLYTVLIPPVQVPVGSLDQIRLLFESIIAVSQDGNKTVIIKLADDDDDDGESEEGESEETEDDEEGIDEDIIEPTSEEEEDGGESELDEDEEGGGLKFFGEVEVCEESVTVLRWNISLSANELPFSEEDAEGELIVHPVIQDPDVLFTCAPYEMSQEPVDGDEPSPEEDDDEDQEVEEEIL